MQITYEIDRDNLIQSVSKNWDRFALANNGGGCTSRLILGTDIRDSLRGEQLRDLFDQLFFRVRKELDPVDFFLRCDSDTHARRLHLRVAPAEDNGLLFNSHTLEEVPFAGIQDWSTLTNSSGSPVQTDDFHATCEVCRDVWIDQRWRNPDALFGKSLKSVCNEVNTTCRRCARDLIGHGLWVTHPSEVDLCNKEVPLVVSLGRFTTHHLNRTSSLSTPLPCLYAVSDEWEFQRDPVDYLLWELSKLVSRYRCNLEKSVLVACEGAESLLLEILTQSTLFSAGLLINPSLPRRKLSSDKSLYVICEEGVKAASLFDSFLNSMSPASRLTVEKAPVGITLSDGSQAVALSSVFDEVVQPSK